MRLSRLKNGITFYQWCIDNDRQDILDRWDYIKNKVNSSEILYKPIQNIIFIAIIKFTKVKSLKNYLYIEISYKDDNDAKEWKNKINHILAQKGFKQ